MGGQGAVGLGLGPARPRRLLLCLQHCLVRVELFCEIDGDLLLGLGGVLEDAIANLLAEALEVGDLLQGIDLGLQVLDILLALLGQTSGRRVGVELGEQSIELGA